MGIFDALLRATCRAQARLIVRMMGFGEAVRGRRQGRR